jgi:predicted dehydrogenase
MTGDNRIGLGIVGLGKIARDQHVPAILHSGQFRLHSTADPSAARAHVPHYADIEAMLAADDAPAAIAVCTPPQQRFAIARYALERGRHVLLEKPPCATVAEVDEIRALAAGSGLTLLAAWHSRFAPAVLPSRTWLAARKLRQMQIDWREDVRDWHPNQAWIWQTGGFGVFDPGINALSIATMIQPGPFTLQESRLQFPANCAAPAVAELHLTDATAGGIRATFDFLKAGPPTWTIAAETEDGGRLLLSDGGGRLAIDGTEVPLGPRDEYPALYQHFEQLIATGGIDADAAPLRLVIEALDRGRRINGPPLDRSYGIGPRSDDTTFV